jgi:thiosulfate reductase cytochrome b subunit
LTSSNGNSTGNGKSKEMTTKASVGSSGSIRGEVRGPIPPPDSPRPIEARRLHPWPVRLMHWTNAIAMIIMILSGWGIYDDYVIVPGLHFSETFRLGTWAAPSLLWHFAGMWLLAVNGLCYVSYGLVTGRLRERMLPIRWTELVQTVRDTLHFKIEHHDLTVYNAVQKLLYIVVILAGISQVVTGVFIWKPIQFSAAVALLGGFQAVRLEHFCGMLVIVGFLIVHVALSLLVPQTLWAMLTGGPRLPAHEELS